MQVSGIEMHTCTGAISSKVGHSLITHFGAELWTSSSSFGHNISANRYLGVLSSNGCTDVYQHWVKALEYFGLVCPSVHLSVHLLICRSVCLSELHLPPSQGHRVAYDYL